MKQFIIYYHPQDPEAPDITFEQQCDSLENYEEQRFEDNLFEKHFKYDIQYV